MQIDFVDAGDYEPGVVPGKCLSHGDSCDQSDECEEHMSRLRKSGGEIWRNGAANSDGRKSEAVAHRTRLSSSGRQEGAQGVDSGVDRRYTEEDGLEADVGTAAGHIRIGARGEAADVRAA